MRKNMNLAKLVRVLWQWVVSPFKWKYLGLLFLLNVWYREFLRAESSAHQTLSRSVPQSYITYHNKYLTGQVKQRLQIDDWLQCLSACASAEECISYNFDPKMGTCELNSGGIIEVERQCQEEKSLLFSQGLIFQQIRGTSYWLPWQPWGPCSATCGSGMKRRMRVCISSNNGGCSGPEMEDRVCNPGACLDISQFCVGRTDGNYPDPSNCFRFIQCSGEQAFLRDCQPGLVYDPVKDQCVYSSDSDCGDR